jgi:opacity protein-like surface antigen
MRKFLAAALIAGLAGATAAAAAVPPQAARIAVSADNLAVQALYHGPALEMGYSAQTRRMTECLATYPGAYDPRTDLVRLASGATRRCTL